MIPRRSVQHARRNAFVVQPKGPKIEGSRGYDVPRACETPGCSKRFPAAKSPRLELCPQPPSVKLATKPIAVDVDDAKLELAKQLGAALAVNARKADPAAFVKKEVGGAQGVLVTAVSPKAFEQALGIVGRGGTVSLNGLPPGDFPVSIFDTVINGITVRGSIVGTRLGSAGSAELRRRGQGQGDHHHGKARKHQRHFRAHASQRHSGTHCDRLLEVAAQAGDGARREAHDGGARFGRQCILIAHRIGTRCVRTRRHHLTSALITSPINWFVATGSSHRKTATMPLAGSIQVQLPPAPIAKKLCGDAFE
jgi:hypothetical protein